MKKAIVYIDGYNLYFGLLKGTPWKWLDLWKFAKSLVTDRFEVVEVRYFTAPIKTHPVDLAATERQNAYVQALLTLPGVKVVQGFYSKNISRDLPARCQLPDAIPVGTHGNVIRRPGVWK